MGESVWVDIDAMRASSSELNQVAARTAVMVAELEAELTLKGEFWGDDEPGKLFAQSYIPGVEQAMAGMAGLVAELRNAERGFAEAADAYSESDSTGANHVADPGSPTVTGELGVSRPPSYRGPASAALPEYGLPATGYHPHADGAGSRDDDGHFSDGRSRTTGTPYSPSPPERSPESETASPGASESADPDGSGQYPGGDGETGAPLPPVADIDAPWLSAPPGGTPPVNTPAPEATPAKPADGARARPVPTGQVGPAGRATGTASPGNLANSPWSKSPPTSPSVTAPQSGTPPRTYPPRPAAPRTEGDKRTAGKPARETARPLVQRPQTSDVEAMRIAREMAARHNLELCGFEAAGLHQHTVRQIEAALDHVLGRYTLPLRGIEIAHVAGAPSRTEVRGTASDPGAPALWIVLHTAAATNPRLPHDPAAASPQSTAAVHQERPIYATVMRALGGALDISGGCRARTEAQRALITEYLRVHGSKGDTLARVVRGYKGWRGGLSGNCFERGIFAPTQALAEAFAAVESNSESAGPPQQVLHRLLVTLARLPDTNL
ncbi:hypothetical protein [Nocardia jinanensis]|uniref:WXG100 family type VII secretion target n=1 Tax=Nocardia jinanensis TaxID=382504 RepID=A0A917RJG1_9NOCA|nr:hypothetical protein [Nocardia jinanensis]GGL11353.1 hypothetical protein GCM10011588_27300 [Nocardia jinanensis]